MPALKAARTALIFAWVNETGTPLTRRFGEASADMSGFLPRRSCSTSTAASNRSSSESRSRLIALGKSLGRTCLGKKSSSDDIVQLFFGSRLGVTTPASIRPVRHQSLNNSYLYCNPISTSDDLALPTT